MIEVTGINDANGNSLWVKPESVSDPVITCSENVVTMTCPTSGAVIHYSTDDGLTWSVYSQTIVISSTTNYKAYASNEGMSDSGIVSYTATYVYMKLPTPNVTRSSYTQSPYNYYQFTATVNGVSGVKYYCRRSTSKYGSVTCSSIADPTTSSYTASGTGTGSNSSYTYKSGIRTTGDYVNVKFIATKPGYVDSDPACYEN